MKNKKNVHNLIGSEVLVYDVKNSKNIVCNIIDARCEKSDEDVIIKIERVDGLLFNKDKKTIWISLV